MAWSTGMRPWKWVAEEWCQQGLRHRGNRGTPGQRISRTVPGAHKPVGTVTRSVGGSGWRAAPTSDPEKGGAGAGQGERMAKQTCRRAAPGCSLVISRTLRGESFQGGVSEAQHTVVFWSSDLPSLCPRSGPGPRSQPDCALEWAANVLERSPGPGPAVSNTDFRVPTGRGWGVGGHLGGPSGLPPAHGSRHPETFLTPEG